MKSDETHCPTHRPETDTGFENGERVLKVEFDYEVLDAKAEENEPDSLREKELEDMRQIVAAAFLEILTANNATPALAGRRAFLLAHKLGLGGYKTQRELAERMGVSPGRVSQMSKSLDEHLPPEIIG